jgi:hypothetical protein
LLKLLLIRVKKIKMIKKNYFIIWRMEELKKRKKKI